MTNFITNTIGLIVIILSVAQYTERNYNRLVYVLLMVLGLGLIDII